jgi:NADH-quinone oxidoreductase subunit N
MNAIILSAILGVVMMFCSAFLKNSIPFRHIALGGFILLLLANVLEFNGTQLFSVKTAGMLTVTRFSLLFGIVITGSVILYLLLSGKDIENTGKNKADYFALLFFIFCGIYMTASFASLLMLFISVEIISIPLYILAASDKRNLKSNEAGLKYFLMGAFSTGIMLLGIAFLYGGMGSFVIENMKPLIVTARGSGVNAWTMIGMVLMMASLAFKVSAAPFHFWTPDVYDGSPTVFTSFMATIVKAAFFIVFIRLFHGLFGTVAFRWNLAIAILTALTLIVGNITAVFQQSVKRMLAYSSIAQAGFMMFAILVSSDRVWQESILLYIVSYSLATVGIFSILLRMSDYTFDGFNGLAKKHPALAAVNTVFLLSLAGIPATAGFFAKYYMLAGAVQNGVYMWLIILAVLCAAVSVYYYFRVIQAMYFKEGDDSVALQGVTPSFKMMLYVTAGLVILLGLLPTLLTSWVMQ